MKKRQRQLPSTLVAIAFVLGAGALAWYGTRPSETPLTATPAARTTETLAAEAPPKGTAGPRLADGSLPTRIVVATAGIDAAVSEVGVVREGSSVAWETAWRSAGHHLDSARPGQPGNMVITGHVSVADRNNLAVFRTLDGVKQGDRVEVHAGDAVYTYEVEKVAVVAPSAINILRSDHASRVTLITCTRDLKNRVVVTGRLV